jgi:SAM-dependent methyltransferase
VNARDPRWNLNIHYHRVFLDAAPADARTALDVGCGDGLLTFDLAERGLDVIGVDPHAASIERAGSDPRATARTNFVCGDVFTSDLQSGSFDLVAASAVLHHIDARAGIRRMKQLVRPGGVVAVVGFGRPDGVKDRLLEVAGAATKRVRLVRREYWEHNAPVSWPPPFTTGQMRDLGHEELPGAVFHQLMSNRFSLVWEAPTVETTNSA